MKVLAVEGLGSGGLVSGIQAGNRRRVKGHLESVLGITGLLSGGKYVRQVGSPMFMRGRFVMAPEEEGGLKLAVEAPWPPQGGVDLFRFP